MVFKTPINGVTRARAFYLRRIKGLSIRKVAEICNISRGSVWRIANETLVNTYIPKKICKRGPKFKLSERQQRQLVRAVRVLRQREGNFTCKRLMQEACIKRQLVSERTVCRYLNAHGYFYLQTRKKGLMNSKDLKKRVQFAKKMQRDYDANVWTRQMAFYLDGTGFAFKRNPMDQAKAPRARIWRKKTEGLEIGCVAKGRKEGTGGKVLKLIVAISFDKGVICCEPYERMCGELFSSFIKNNFNRLFRIADKGDSRMWLQDGDPSQNSALARSAMCHANSTLIKLPPRSPDFNPVENLFPIVGRILKKQALQRNITRETFEEFKTRVKGAFLSVSVETINKLIASMSKRIASVIKNKGRRLKY